MDCRVKPGNEGLLSSAASSPPILDAHRSHFLMAVVGAKALA
jgi:hypothetical protein